MVYDYGCKELNINIYIHKFNTFNKIDFFNYFLLLYIIVNIYYMLLFY